MSVTRINSAVGFHQPYGGRKIKFVNAWARLKDGMTTETRNALLKADRKPAQGTRDGRKYDERRACEYMRQLTGDEFFKAVWDESNRVVHYVIRHHDNAKVEIPNWDAAIVETDLDTLVSQVLAA